MGISRIRQYSSETTKNLYVCTLKIIFVVKHKKSVICSPSLQLVQRPRLGPAFLEDPVDVIGNFK